MKTKVIDSIKYWAEVLLPSSDKMSAGDLQWYVNTLREDNRQLQEQLHKAQQQRTEALEKLEMAKDSLHAYRVLNDELRARLRVPDGKDILEYIKTVDVASVNDYVRIIAKLEELLEVRPSKIVPAVEDLQELATIQKDLEELVLPDSETMRKMAASVKRLEIKTKESKKMTEEKQAPVFDSVGVEVRGDVKEMYTIRGTSKTHGKPGEFWFTTRTSCGRDVVSILHPSGTYEVAIFLNGELERGYRGKEGSDAHRVYDGSLRVWAMKEARAELGPTVFQVEDMRFIELAVPEGEHCLPPEAVPPPPTVRIVGVDFAAEEQAARRAHPEYQQMLLNLTNTQERCTRQEQEIRDLKAAVFNLTSARSAVVEELEEMTEQYEEARSRADGLQDELLVRGSE